MNTENVAPVESNGKKAIAAIPNAVQRMPSMASAEREFENTAALKGYQFNLGELTVTDNQEVPQAPTALKVAKQSLKNGERLKLNEFC